MPSYSEVPNSVNSAGTPQRPDGETLAERLARSTPAELQEAARAMGVDAVWDRMILPIIAGD